MALFEMIVHIFIEGESALVDELTKEEVLHRLIYPQI